jgi:DNA-binding GntR family transcriptional regulator
MPKHKKNAKENFEQVIAKMENMILTGMFQPRERLIELTLAKKLNVSRFWIRDALKILETKGLVKMIPYKGAVVSDLDEEEIEGLFQVRAALEKLAIRLASKYVRKEDIKTLKRMAKYVEESFHRQDFREMISANTNFHDYIIELSKNPILLETIKQLRARCHILRHHSWSSHDTVKQILFEHKQFIEGLENNDAEMLEDLSEKHISHAKNSYLLQLKAKKASFQ